MTCQRSPSADARAGTARTTPMTLDLKVADLALAGLRTFPVAITTLHEGRSNGLMSLSAGMASIVPEAPRVTVGITQYGFLARPDPGLRDLRRAPARQGRRRDRGLAGDPHGAGRQLRAGRRQDEALRHAPRRDRGADPARRADVRRGTRRAHARRRREHDLPRRRGRCRAAARRRSARHRHGLVAAPPGVGRTYERDHEAQIDAARRCRGLLD